MGNRVNIDLLDHRFRHLFEEAPFAAALYTGPDFIIEMANETSLKLWQKDSSILGLPLLQAMPEMETQPLFQILTKVYAAGIVFEGKERTVIQGDHGNPKKIYVNFVYKPVRDDDKNITGILAIGYDVSDQVSEKKKLEELEERARMAIESAGLGTFDLDYKTGTIITTKRFANIFGFDASVQLSDYLSRIHPDDLPIRNAAELQAFETGKFQYEVRLLMPDQSFRWIRVNGTLIFDDDSLPTRLIGIALDITDEKNAIEKLQESEERFRTLITETPEVGAGLYVGPEIRIQYVNDVMLKVWGKDSSIVGKTIREALPELEGQPFFEQLEKVYSTGIEFSGKEVYALLKVDGKLQAGYYNYTYKALRRPNGKIYGIHHMSVDVTEQVLNKFKLIENEAAVRRLFEQTPVGIGIFKGESFIIENANAALLSYGGRKYEDIINKPLFSIIPELEEQGIRAIAQNVYNTGIPYTSPEARIKIRVNGKVETIYVHFAFQPRKDKHGKIFGLMVIAHDITDMVEARKKVEKNEQLFKHLANSMPQVVWIAERDGTVSYYNNRVREFSGAKQTDNGGWMWEWQVHPDDMKASTDAWNAAVKNLTTYQQEHRVMMSDGS
ncbi:MAG TPA: PAS domain-containing protein, partial [Chryseolinea sp.]|nr:PAS domain-containing protein [Chryseolinea sp.]